jgi:hypothetical protein
MEEIFKEAQRKKEAKESMLTWSFSNGMYYPSAIRGNKLALTIASGQIRHPGEGKAQKYMAAIVALKASTSGQRCDWPPGCH